MFAWNSKSYHKNNYLIIIGISYLFVAVIDMFHAFTYKGMGLIALESSNVPTQLWIAARYMESLSLLGAFLFMKKRFAPEIVFIFYFIIFMLVFSSVFLFKNFPDCYIEGQGLTLFKILSEYLISLILILTAAILSFRKDSIDNQTYKYILSAIFITILSEIFFTFYIDVYGISNLAGHLLKIASCYLMYIAVIKNGFTKPYDILFRDLSQKTTELEKALEKVNVLSGFLPICASCKKIRDDKGYWNLLEDYISNHSEAEFSHGICPDCIMKYYPDLVEDE